MKGVWLAAVSMRFAKLVTANLRQMDIVARWGGEEFTLHTPETPLDGAIRLAEKLRSEIEGYGFSEPKKVTTSFGFATFRNEDNNTTLVNRADEALYRAKEGGRNQVACHG